MARLKAAAAKAMTQLREERRLRDGAELRTREAIRERNTLLDR